LGDWLNWLNANQGSALVILTLVYVVATITMVCVMAHTNRLTLRLEEQRSRPMVVFSMVQREDWVQAILKNSGVTPAYDVTVTCTPSLTRVGANTELALTAHSTTFLPPQESITDLIDVGHQFFQRYPNPVFTAVVKYKDKAGRSYEEEFRTDLSVYLHCTYTMKPDPGRELREIRNILDSLVPRFDPPLIRMIDETEYRKQRADFATAGATRSFPGNDSEPSGEEGLKSDAAETQEPRPDEGKAGRE
jgi:hypothetical protein